MKTNLLNQGAKAKKKRQIITWAAVIALAGILTAGCGGSSGNSNAAPGDNSTALLEGTFIDSPVQGLDYYSATHSGVTDEDGHFMYYEGEMMTFAIGDVVLGQATAHEVMTPMDFLDSSETPFDVTHPLVTNMGRFMQSLDADGNPENGIMISQEVRNEVSGRMIDFHQNIHEFEADPHVSALFDTLNGLSMPHNGMMWGLVTIENAQQHMNEHLSEYMGRYMDDNTMGPDTGGGIDNGSMGSGSGMDNQMGGSAGNSSMGGGM